MFRTTHSIFKNILNKIATGAARSTFTGGAKAARVGAANVLVGCATALVGCALFLGGCALFLGGCATMEDDKPKLRGPAIQVMTGSYDEIWRAIQKSFAGYPIQINNLDQGILETDVIKGAQVWVAPFEKSPRPSNYHYVINVRVVKGRSKGKESAQVTVVKRISMQRDFFSADEETSSDGLEEKSLLYRIERELQIERSLRKAFEKSKN